jgi:hypothetical protein
VRPGHSAYKYECLILELHSDIYSQEIANAGPLNLKELVFEENSLIYIDFDAPYSQISLFNALITVVW